MAIQQVPAEGRLPWAAASAVYAESVLNSVIFANHFVIGANERNTPMATPQRLLILSCDARRYYELLCAAQPPNLEITAPEHGDSPPRDLDAYTIILGEPDRVAAALPHATRLRWVQSTFAGVDALCLPHQPRNYILTGVKGIFGPLIAEYVFAQILSLERDLEGMRADQQARVWRQRRFRRLGELTLGLCGLGDIGRHLARTAVPFGMRVVAYKRTPDRIPPVECIYSGKEWEPFLGRADYLVLSLPQTPATTHLIDARALAMMKPSAVLINVGRGSAVAQNDLIDALGRGVIRGAVLDVFEDEPLPLESPLWDLPNVIITPHIAGISYAEGIVPIFLENYRRYRRGAPLNYRIDFNRGY